MKTEDVLGLDITDLMLQVTPPGDLIKQETTIKSEAPVEKKESDVLDLNVNNIFESSSELVENKEDAPKSSTITTDANKESKVTEDITKESKTPAPKDSKSSGEDFTLVFARYLKEQGTLTDLNEEELQTTLKDKGQTGALEYLIQKEIDTHKEEVKNTYDEATKRFFELVEGGVDEGDAAEIIKSSTALANITDAQIEENEDLRKGLLTEMYKMQMPGADAKRINKAVANHIALGEDVEEAKLAKQELVKLIANREVEVKKAAEQERTTAEQNRVENLKKLHETIEAIDEIIPGQKINKITKQKIEDFITKPAKEVNGKPVNGIWAKRAENPVKFDATLAYMLITGAFDGKAWDKVTKVATTKVVKDLESALKSQTFETLFNGKVVTDQTNYGANTDTSRRMIEEMKSAGI